MKFGSKIAKLEAGHPTGVLLPQICLPAGGFNEVIPQAFGR